MPFAHCCYQHDAKCPPVPSSSRPSSRLPTGHTLGIPLNHLCLHDADVAAVLGRTWLQAHIDDVKYMGKPLVLEEFGKAVGELLGPYSALSYEGISTKMFPALF